MPSYTTYKRQMAVLDADDIESWITVKGNHIPIKKGQSKEEAVKSFLESKGSNSGGKTESKYDPEFETVRKNALANGNVYGGKYTQKSKAEAYKEYKNDTSSKENMKKANEFVNGKPESNNQDPRPKNADAETINDVLFSKYVPKQGKADTLLGEQLRAINKIVYRYENDGDMYGNGYGVETVNAPVKFLRSLYEEKSIPGLSGILSSLKNAAKTNDTAEYEYNIQRLKNVMVNADWKTLKKLADTKNDEDMYSFEDDTKYDDDEEEW